MKDIYLTAGRFAKLHNVNVRTLHYYDSIGLFSPYKTGRNGYRYYTYMQGADFEIILALRELGMSIEEIRKYQENRNSESLANMFLEKEREIDGKIKQMKGIQSILREKRNNLVMSQSDNINEIDIVNCEREFLFLTDISGVKSEDDVDDKIVAGLSGYEPGGRAVRAYLSSYGSMIPADDALNGRYGNYRYIFVKIPEPEEESGLFEKPEGRYLRAFCRGPFDGISDTYMRMSEYAEARGLELTGYAYEEGINEMAIGSPDDMDKYVTQITIRCI